MLEGRSYRLQLYAGGAQLYAFGVHLYVEGLWIFAGRAQLYGPMILGASMVYRL